MRGSYFYILRRSENNKVFSKKAFNKIIEEKGWLYDDFKQEKLDIKDIQTYQLLNDFKCLSIENKTEYDILLQAHFTSNFTCLIEQFNMNAYNKFGEKIISLATAKQMLQAINYILSLNYSRQTELILNNYFIDVFEDLYSLFYNRYLNTSKECIDIQEQLSYNDKDGLYYLKKIKTVLDTFILLNNQNCFSNLQYVLVYKNY